MAIRLNKKEYVNNIIKKGTMGVFIKPVPNDILYDLLHSICTFTGGDYCMDQLAYKKLIFKNGEKDFIEKIKVFYHPSKQFYLERKMTYNAFMTIIRQICKHNGIPFHTKLNFDKSDYHIDYYVKEPRFL